MTVDESVKQLIHAQLSEQLGEDHKKFNTNFDILDKRIIGNSDEIKKIKLNIKAYTDTIDKIKDIEQKIGKVLQLETLFLKLNEKQSTFAQETKSKITDLENANKGFLQYCKKLENENNNNLQKISALEAKNNELLKKLNEKETKNNLSPNTVRTPYNNELFDQTDNIINSFNNWASCPDSYLPREFAYVTGDFRIRTNQQNYTETREETKWIINRKGSKKYLFPNPNSFNQMTNLDLYEMDLSMLKEKGKNKIRIITPCEISSSGFIEFKGLLQILN